MRISPYVSFNGNCAEAVALYEKAFKVSAKIMRYKDAPPSEGYPMNESTGDLVMHAQFEIGDEAVMLCDMPPESPVNSGDNIAIMVEFDDVESARSAFDVLKEGAKVTMDLQETFWSKCFGSLVDRFGISWNISITEA